MLRSTSWRGRGRRNWALTKPRNKTCLKDTATLKFKKPCLQKTWVKIQILSVTNVINNTNTRAILKNTNVRKLLNQFKVEMGPSQQNTKWQNPWKPTGTGNSNTRKCYSWKCSIAEKKSIAEISKAFRNFIRKGEINSALKLLSDNMENGILPLDIFLEKNTLDLKKPILLQLLKVTSLLEYIKSGMSLLQQTLLGQLLRK